jgi:uridine monophosphate synthetase
VPYAALPLGTAVSLETGLPLIYTRKEPKSHGRARQIEGEFSRGECVIPIEDLVTTAGSLIKSVGILREAGLTVEHAAVLIDREQGGVENLARAGVHCHAAFSITQLLDILHRERRISAQQYAMLSDYLQSN